MLLVLSSDTVVQMRQDLADKVSWIVGEPMVDTTDKGTHVTSNTVGYGEDMGDDSLPMLDLSGTVEGLSCRVLLVFDPREFLYRLDWLIQGHVSNSTRDRIMAILDS